MHFRVGVFVLFALIATALLIWRFGEMPALGGAAYEIYVTVPTAPGAEPEVPVRMAGVRIGQVREVRLEDRPDDPGVTLVLSIERRYRLRSDVEPYMVRSLLGDSSVEFMPGKADTFLQPGARLKGFVRPDPLVTVQELGAKIEATLKPWESLGGRLDRLVQTREGDIDKTIERLATSLASFNQAMENANTLLADKENQENVRRTLKEMPQFFADAREAVVAVREATQKADASLANLEKFTGVLAERGGSIAEKLDDGACKANELLTELTAFAKAIRDERGSLAQLLSNPQLYTNLNTAAGTLSSLLTGLQPVVRDLQIFSDQVARYPELLGVGGALQPSSGVKAGNLPTSARSRGMGLPLFSNPSGQRGQR